MASQVGGAFGLRLRIAGAAKAMTKPTMFKSIIDVSFQCLKLFGIFALRLKHRTSQPESKMPVPETAAVAGQKRKRDPTRSDRKPSKVKARRKSLDTDASDGQATILQLEAQIVESRRHYNNIVALIQTARGQDVEEDVQILAAVSLCRVFSRLLSAGDMVRSKGMAESEVVIVQWLKERYNEYTALLLASYLRSESGAKQSTGLTLLMRLIKSESRAQKDYNWKNGLPNTLVGVLLALPDGDAVREEFGEKYFKPFDDVRYHTFQSIR